MPPNPTIDYIELIKNRIVQIQLEIIDEGVERGNLSLDIKKRMATILQDTIDVLENEILLEELNNNPWTKNE